MRTILIILASSLLASAASATPPFPLPPPPPPPPVTAEALALGRELVFEGGLMSVVGMMTYREVQQLLKERPGLSPQEQETIERLARARSQDLLEQVGMEMGLRYARRLKEEDMRAMLAFFRSPPGRAYLETINVMRQEVQELIGPGDEFRAKLTADFCNLSEKCEPQLPERR